MAAGSRQHMDFSFSTTFSDITLCSIFKQAVGAGVLQTFSIYCSKAMKK